MRNSPTLETEFLNALNCDNTRISYQNDIYGFLEFIRPLGFEQVTRDHILEWKNHLLLVGGRDGEPSAPYTVAKKLSALKAYFSFLAEHRKILNPFIDIESPSRVIKNERQILDIQDMEEMISKTSKSSSAHDNSLRFD
ncbi:MAG: site-specific integrase [Bacteriovoracaceae bacterium]